MHPDALIIDDDEEGCGQRWTIDDKFNFGWIRKLRAPGGKVRALKSQGKYPRIW
jgi:hypothetical protein